MEKSFKLFGLIAILLLISGCFSTRPALVSDKTSVGGFPEPYSGPKAKIAISDFELKTSGVNPEVGLALKEYFTSILISTKRFVIVGPQEADLIISVGIIEFIPESSGGKSGLAGGGSSASSFMGGLLGEVLSKANMQLNVRIIDRESSSVTANRDIQRQAVENPGKKIETPHDKVFKGDLSEYAGTPMGKVIYDCLIESGRYIIQNIPSNYYKN